MYNLFSLFEFYLITDSDDSILYMCTVSNILAVKFDLQVAEFNVQAAQQGMVYIDEVDKITKKVP